MYGDGTGLALASKLILTAKVDALELGLADVDRVVADWLGEDEIARVFARQVVDEIAILSNLEEKADGKYNALYAAIVEKYNSFSGDIVIENSVSKFGEGKDLVVFDKPE